MCRYERGVSVLSGRAVMQRHEANLVDIANSSGQGPLVSGISLHTCTKHSCFSSHAKPSTCVRCWFPIAVEFVQAVMSVVLFVLSCVLLVVSAVRLG